MHVSFVLGKGVGGEVKTLGKPALFFSRATGFYNGARPRKQSGRTTLKQYIPADAYGDFSLFLWSSSFARLFRLVCRVCLPSRTCETSLLPLPSPSPSSSSLPSSFSSLQQCHFKSFPETQRKPQTRRENMRDKHHLSLLFSFCAPLLRDRNG